MALERYFHQEVESQEVTGMNKTSLKQKSFSPAQANSDDSQTGDFECNICLEVVQDPVVTLCGHLYCWPCIYKWLQVRSVPADDQEEQQPQCPVCKAEVFPDTLVPLYGRGQTIKASKAKTRHLGIVIPRRPLGPCGFDSPRSITGTSTPRTPRQNYIQNYDSHQPQPYYSPLGNHPASPTMMNLGGSTTTIIDPMIGMLGEMVFARMFGGPITNLYANPNSYNLAGSSSPRVRRHFMQADKSLSRICFFLFCCIVLCLLLF